MYKCHEINEHEAITLDTISCPCIYMHIDTQLYLAVPINKKELEQLNFMSYT